MKKIAITGGIGSGKTTVAKEILLLGFPVFSCDAIYKEILQDRAYIAQISKVFNGVVKDGEIDKKALSGLVFSDKSARQKLNEIAHPLIMKQLYAHMQACASDLVFAEVPLLFEGGYEKDFDYIIVVERGLEKRIENVMQRDGVSRLDVLARINAQFDYENIKNSNVYFLENDGGLDEIKSKIKKLLSKLQNS